MERCDKRYSMTEITRRDVLRVATGGAAVLAASAGGVTQAEVIKRKGRIKQGICGFWRRKMSKEELYAQCKRLGIVAMDFISPKEWPELKDNGIVCSLTGSHSLKVGLNQKKNHESCLASIRKSIEDTSAAGFPNVICFSGNGTPGLSREEGMDNCVEALKQVAGLAEKKNVTLCMELLNSKVNHKGYMCDTSAWGVEMCKKVGSPNVKLLYDIYHMQIMEGDIIRTIQNNIDYFGHIHTAGNPGRNEIDESQELYYPAIMRAIADSGYKGYVSHEFSAKGDPLKALEYAVRVCDV